LIDPSVRAELLRLETALASRDARGLAGGLSHLIADDFIELGASGTVWDVDATRRRLESDPLAGVAIEGFAVAELAPGVVLATYRIGGTRPSNRSSIWTVRDGRWVMRFHQGTLRPG
jgi:hypothetical protein